MSTIAEALDHPVSPGIASAVWQAHEEQVERMKRESGTGAVMRGEVKWSASAALFQFVPDADSLDILMDRIASGEWAAGMKVTITL